MFNLRSVIGRCMCLVLAVLAAPVVSANADDIWAGETSFGPALEGELMEAYFEADDAYAWHLNGVRSRERRYDDYEATGNGGQMLLVIPELELVVVLTGGNYQQGGIWNRWRDEIVGAEIIPAIRR